MHFTYTCSTQIHAQQGDTRRWTLSQYTQLCCARKAPKHGVQLLLTQEGSESHYTTLAVPSALRICLQRQAQTPRHLVWPWWAVQVWRVCLTNHVTGIRQYYTTVCRGGSKSTCLQTRTWWSGRPRHSFCTFCPLHFMLNASQKWSEQVTLWCLHYIDQYSKLINSRFS